MKITIDASQIVYETGVSVYTRNLIKALLKYDKTNDYLIIGGSLRKYQKLDHDIKKIIKGYSNASTKLFTIPPFAADVIFNRFGLISIDPFIGKTDVFHSSDWTQPKSSAFKITTVHDLVPIKFPSLTHPKIISVHNVRLERVRRYADQVIVPSETTKEDLIKFGISENKITVIPEAPDIDFVKPSEFEVEEMKKRYRITGKYLLAVGANPRKNIDRIIDAFEKARASIPLKLIVIGRSDKMRDVRNVTFLGHIPKKDVPMLYSGSEALIYPSLYEGFGLPILEAYKLGIPVVTSNIGSLKEVGGGALLVDPYDTGEISDGIIKILANRNKYILNGKKELANYSWKKTAQMTLEVYRKSN